MRLVVLPKEYRWNIRLLGAVGQRGQLLHEQALQKELVLEPDGHGADERPKSPGGKSQVRFQQALKLEEGLVVIGDVAQVSQGDPALAQAISNRLLRGSRASCLLRLKRSSWAAATILPSVSHQAGSAVVVKGRNPKDVHRITCPPEASPVRSPGA